MARMLAALCGLDSSGVARGGASGEDGKDDGYHARPPCGCKGYGSRWQHTRAQHARCVATAVAAVRLIPCRW
jgi:hypothetical protein